MPNPHQLTIALGRSHGDERPTAATSDTQSPPLGVRGARFRSLVVRVVAERERTLRYGWAGVNPAAIRERMRPVEQWVRDHSSFVSDAECVACWKQHGDSLSLIAPSNTTGLKLFRELQSLIQAI